MKAVDQICNNFLMDSQEPYDCSLGNNSLVDWSTRGTVRPIYGTLSICFALVTIPFYMLSAIIIWPLRRQSCYKIMFALAISDMCTLLSNALAFGVFLIRGEMYCKNPKMHFVNSMVAVFFFCSSSIVCWILAANRLLDLLFSRWGNAVFKRSRTWKILAVSYLYPSFIAFFTPPFFFNSDVHLLITNPGINEDKYEYISIAAIFNNTGMPSLSVLAYLVMLMHMVTRKRRSEGSSKTNAVARATMMAFYEVAQFVIPSETILYVGHISWMMVHGLPPFVYFIFNQSIRSGMRQYIAPVHSSIMMAPSTMMPPRSAVSLPQLPTATRPTAATTRL